MQRRNTGGKDALGRTIYAGPRGGLFVLTATGKRAAVKRSTKAPFTTNLPPNAWRLISQRANSNSVKALRATSASARHGAGMYLEDRRAQTAVLRTAINKAIKHSQTTNTLVRALRQAPNNMTADGDYLRRDIRFGNNRLILMRTPLDGPFPSVNGHYTVSKLGGVEIGRISSDKKRFLVYPLRKPSPDDWRMPGETHDHRLRRYLIDLRLRRFLRAACLHLGMVEFIPEVRANGSFSIAQFFA